MGKKSKSETRKNKKCEKPKKTKKNRSHQTKRKSLESNSLKSSTLKKKITKKKNLLIPLNTMNIKPKKEINKMTIEELKEFASEFDLNPQVNYKILYFLKEKKSSNEFEKYIGKYKYTLDFQDAHRLSAFNVNDVKLILGEFNENFPNNSIKGIKNIVSLSKLKLFNFLSYLLKFKQNPSAKTTIQNVKNQILKYANSETLIFKVPNRFGNIELQFYTYLTMLINYFISEIVNNDDDINGMIIEHNKIDYTSSSKEQIYFDWNTKKKGKSIDIDLTDFYERKEKLESILEINKSDDQNMNIISTHSKKKKDIKNIIPRFFHECSKLYFFNDRIFEMLDESDEIILKKIRFIFYIMKFKNITNMQILSCYSNCLKSNYTKEEIENSCIYLKNLKGIKEFNLSYSNINYNFINSLENPFIFNSLFYSFPTLLEKNILQNSKELYNNFKNYIKYIYSSEIMKDIYYLCPESNDFVYPLDKEEFVNEIFDYTIFAPLDISILHGYTQKEIPEIIIAVNLEKENPEETDLSKIICELSQILNTTIHEQAKHYIKSLIFYNSFRFNIKKRINSNLYDYEEENKFIRGILQKYDKKQNYNNLSIDGGEKAEIYLYGTILKKIYFPQAFELFKFSNWKRTIWEHIDKFQNNKKLTEGIVSKDISNDEDLCDFLKNFIFKFMKIFNKHKKNVNNKFIVFNTNASANKLSKNDGIIESNNTIILDFNECLIIQRNKLRDASC